MWNLPHIVILDEPTNYLDRDGLGALTKAIEELALFYKKMCVLGEIFSSF